MKDCFTLAEIFRLRTARRAGARMDRLCAAFPHHTRDELVEAIDAIVRHQDDLKAMREVNRVLMHQEARVPLVNGRPALRLVTA
jgi:hypothetical protein